MPVGEPFVQLISGGNDTGVRHSLEQAGLKVVSTRIDDLRLLSSNRLEPTLITFDLIGTEHQAPDLLQLLQANSVGCGSPVLVISDDSNPETKVRALEAGAADYVTTPLVWPELVARVKVQLRIQQAVYTMADSHARHLELLAAAQKFCMPQPRQMPGAKFEVAFQQVHMAGGDFYEVIELGDRRFDYIVADASGHDLSASYWTLSLKTLLSEYSHLRFSPADALYLINRSLIRLLPTEVFFTTVYVRVNRTTGEVQLLNGGHPPMIYLPADNGRVQIVEQVSDVVGCFGDANFARLEMKARPGDRLFLLSDGLIECCGTAAVGLEKLAADLSRLRGEPLQKQVTATFANQLQDCPPEDDALLLGIEM